MTVVIMLTLAMMMIMLTDGYDNYEDYDGDDNDDGDDQRSRFCGTVAMLRDRQAPKCGRCRLP